jgi:hypothetical protein
VWYIAKRGFMLKSICHYPGKKHGLISVKTPIELGGTKTRKGGNKTQVVVVQLLEQLPKRDSLYYVYLNNLFVSKKLLELFRSKGYAVTRTCRTNSGIISELIELKKKDKGKNKIPWGTFYDFPTE